MGDEKEGGIKHDYEGPDVGDWGIVWVWRTPHSFTAWLSPWMSRFVPLSLSLPAGKMELTVPVLPTSQSSWESERRWCRVRAVKAIKPTAGCSFKGRLRE